MITLKPVTNKNLGDIIGLKVKESQKDFIEPVRDCLEEAEGRSCWRPVGIYSGKTPIGFAMYGYFEEEGRVWLDRFLIDASFQGKGYGEQALTAIIDRLKSEYGCDKIYLSLYENNHSACKLYAKHGFVFNGEKDINGEKVMVLLLKQG